MKLRCILTSVALLVSLSASNLFAEDQKNMSADELFNGCELALKATSGSGLTDVESLQAMRAMAYVDGYVDAIAMVQKTSPQVSIIDFTRQPSNEVILNRIVEAIHANPKVRTEGTARIVIMYVLRSLAANP